jgi:hypothetical protein
MWNICDFEINLHTVTRICFEPVVARLFVNAFNTHVCAFQHAVTPQPLEARTAF